jgi:hypothetical protein
MSFLSQFEMGEPLMRWREPNAYIRRGLLQHGGCIIFIVVLLIPSLLLIASRYLGRAGILLASAFIVIGAFIFVRVWFGPGDVVCFNKDCITKASSRPPRRTRYKDIVSCSVGRDSYHYVKFAIITFALKKGLPAGQVAQIALFDDPSLERALHILRDKGIEIEGPSDEI